MSRPCPNLTSYSNSHLGVSSRAAPSRLCKRGHPLNWTISRDRSLPSMKSIVLLNDTSSDLHHGCSLVVRTIETLAIECGLKIVTRSKCMRTGGRTPAYWNACDKPISSSSTAKGTIHHDRQQGAFCSRRELGAPTQDPCGSSQRDLAVQQRVIRRSLKNFDLVGACPRKRKRSRDRTAGRRLPDRTRLPCSTNGPPPRRDLASW